MAEKSAKQPGAFRRFFLRIGRFFLDTRGELKKVVWPTPKQVWNNLVIVLLFVGAATLIVYGLDTLFGWLLQVLLKLVADVTADSSSIVSTVLAAVRF